MKIKNIKIAITFTAGIFILGLSRPVTASGFDLGQAKKMFGEVMRSSRQHSEELWISGVSLIKGNGYILSSGARIDNNLSNEGNLVNQDKENEQVLEKAKNGNFSSAFKKIGQLLKLKQN